MDTSDVILKFKEWLKKNMHMAIDANMVLTLIENIEKKDKLIAALRTQLADREIEAKAKDLLIETQRAALTSQQWVIDSLKETLMRYE